MSNYSQTTSFTPKDTLPTNDPNKTIFGAQFDTELGNIASAVNSKPDNLTAASFLNINVTGSGVPANGWYLPSANTLGVATNSVQRGTIDSSGKWTINAPSSGVPLTVTSLASTNGATFLVPSGSAAIFVGIQGQTNNPRIVITPTEASGNSDINFASSTATVAGSISVNSAASISFSASRNVTIGAPISGTPLAVTAVSGGGEIQKCSTNAARGAGNGFLQIYDNTGAKGYWGYGNSNDGFNIQNLLNANLTLGTNATVNAVLVPSGGSSVTVTGADFYARGIAICKTKAGATTRTTNLPSADPDLLYAVPGAGTYAFEIWFRLSGDGTSASHGLIAGPYYTGTFTAGSSICAGFGTINNVVAASQGSSVSSTAATGSFSFAAIAASNIDWLCIKGNLVATGAGNLGLNWSQNTVGSGNTTVQAGAYMTVTQLS